MPRGILRLGSLGVAALPFLTSACAGAVGSETDAPLTPAAQRSNESRAAAASADAASERVELERLRELAKSPDPAATGRLIEAASDAQASPAVTAEAKRLLAARRTGAEYMLEALESDRPPVGALAEALLAMREAKAAPLLARVLNEPSTDSEDLEKVARALSELATPAEKEELETFFMLYRATASDPAQVKAVVSVAKALLRVGGEEGRELIKSAEADHLTDVEVQKLLAPLTAEE